MRYYLHFKTRRPCPSCGTNVKILISFGDSPREAATTKERYCPKCFPRDRDNHIRGFGTLKLLDPWYGVDLDGCLAKWDGDVNVVGEPIMPMVERVRQMLADGKVVKIFTARVADTGAYSPYSDQFDGGDFVRYQRTLIKTWCRKYVGVELPITATKDMACLEIYDDRAKQVIADTGILVEDQWAKDLENITGIFGSLRASTVRRDE